MDYCKDCSLESRGEDRGDLSGMCEHAVETLCDGCGWIVVDKRGKKLYEAPDIDEDFSTSGGFRKIPYYPRASERFR